jgi:electron transfer flavoprotein alpha subunit
MKILVVAEQRENKFKKPSFEAAKAANDLGGKLGGEIVGLVIGENVKAIAPELGGFGISRVIAVENPKLAYYSTTAYAKIVAEVARKEGTDVILISATALGKDLAPRVAVKLDAGLAVDCTALEVDQGRIVATRPVYAGKALIDVTITAPVKIFSLRPNVFTAGSSNGAAATVESREVNLTDADFASVVTAVTQSAGKLDVAEADIIVSGGRGLKGPENFKMIEECAEVLGAAVGASRAVVDAGWRPHDEQVGQTGKTVSPSLYVAVAISGAVQHLAGMSSSKYIVAINKEKEAPIFQVADYGIAGDAFEIVPALTQELRKLKGK